MSQGDLQKRESDEMKSYGVSITVKDLTYNFHVGNTADVRLIIKETTATITNAEVFEEGKEGNRRLSDSELLSILLAK